MSAIWTALSCARVRRAARSSTAASCLRSTAAGSDTVDFTDASKAYFFPVGLPGLFRQYNAPADFVETANTIGLPRYAKQAVDQQFARWVMLHVQSNPLPICTRPGDQLTVDGQTFIVQGEPERRDSDRLVWTLDVRPA